MTQTADPVTITITLPDGAKAGWPVLIDALRRAKRDTGLDLVFGGLIEQVLLQTSPKIEEPNLFGTIVADREGLYYSLVDSSDEFSWYGPEGWRRWRDIDAFRVVVHGVNPA